MIPELYETITTNPQAIDACGVDLVEVTESRRSWTARTSC